MSGKTYSAVAIATQKMKIHAFDLPVVGEDDGLLKVEMCGVCGSDPRIYQWTEPDNSRSSWGTKSWATLMRSGAGRQRGGASKKEIG
jgi:hypothetical protein